MKITSNSTAPKAAATSAVSGSKRGSGSRQSSSTSTSSSDTDSTRLSQLEAQFSQADFSASKVSEISSAIASGRYQVDTGAIADKLISSTAALSGKSRGNA